MSAALQPPQPPPRPASPDDEPILLADEAASAALGARIGQELEPGDLVALSGEIGAGKTTVARAILRTRLADPALEAPSPTFTLVQSYDGPKGPVLHVDLYRIRSEAELPELGTEDWAEASVLVEWPERAPALLDRPRLDVRLEMDAATGGRRATLSGAGPLLERMRRRRALDRMLAAAGWGEARRLPMSGDASSRIYERLVQPSGKRAILMISPPRPDGPPVRRGRSYSAIAHLAESVHAFVAMGRGLSAQGFTAPRIMAEDLEAGLLMLEDLGQGSVLDEAGRPMPERYGEATRVLAALHGRPLPAELPVTQDRPYALPPYDLDAMLIEAELLLDWYVPEIVGTQASGSVRAEFVHAWREALAGPLAGPQTWTLRDYHSPNLVWLPMRSGLSRVGLLDFQDAVLGPPAYDVASLLQDARVDVAPELELRLLGTYAAARRATDPGFDTAAFATSYAIMAAQRATKILGIFARLNRRDGKPQYLRHLPRIGRYLLRNLEHPALARLKRWFAANVPQLFPLPERAEASAAGTDPQPATGAGSSPVTAAIVLAAGLGQRMRPITDTVPKPMVPVGGRPLIDHALARLREAGLARVVVNVHHLADQIEAHVAGAGGLAVTVSDERDALLETGGGVKRALPLLGDTFLVMNSDSLWTETGAPAPGGNVGRLLAAWDPDRMDALLLLASRDSLGYDGQGDFQVAADGRLARRGPETPEADVYAGVAILKAASFADTPDGAFSLNVVFDRAVAGDRLYGLRLDGEWLHVGTPEAIGAAEERLAAAGSSIPSG